MSSQGAVGPIVSIPIAAVNGSSQTLVAAVPASAPEPAKKIRILALYLTGATGTVTLHDDAGTPNALSGAMAIAAGQPVNLQKADCGWGDTAAGQALKIDTTAAVNGILTYQLIK